MPSGVGLSLVDEHRTMLSAVRGQVGLLVAVDIELPDRPSSHHRILEDRGLDRVAIPRNVPRTAQVERYQTAYQSTESVGGSIGGCLIGLAEGIALTV